MTTSDHTSALLFDASATVNYRVSPIVGSARLRADIPHFLGRFRVLGEIARGGMGIVLRAYDADLDREVAVKLLSSESEAVSSHEARVASQLQHPGIMPVYEAGTLPDGRAFFAMPLVVGQTLAALLSRRKSMTRGIRRWLRVFEQVCRAVAHAHEHRIVHRDLKPGNVMIADDGKALVMDWGVSARVGSVGDQEAGRWVFGTPAYMPPEQARGNGAPADTRADVFGLGAILCEILSGLPPYLAGDPARLSQLAAEADLRSCHQRLADSTAPRAVVSLARWCLAADPGLRPAEGGEVVREIAMLRRSQAWRGQRFHDDCRHSGSSPVHQPE